MTVSEKMQTRISLPIYSQNTANLQMIPLPIGSHRRETVSQSSIKIPATTSQNRASLPGQDTSYDQEKTATKTHSTFDSFHHKRYFKTPQPLHRIVTIFVDHSSGVRNTQFYRNYLLPQIPSKSNITSNPRSKHTGLPCQQTMHSTGPPRKTDMAEHRMSMDYYQP
jgi:hypothetical protein